jgi:hypothetical protein
MTTRIRMPMWRIVARLAAVVTTMSTVTVAMVWTHSDARGTVRHRAAIAQSGGAALFLPAALADEALRSTTLEPVHGPTVTPAVGPTRTPGITRTPTRSVSPTPTTVPLYDIAAHLGGRTGAVALDGDTAYLGMGTRVAAVDVSDPARPVPLGESESLGGIVQDLVFDGVYVHALVQAIEDISEYLPDKTVPAALVTLAVDGDHTPTTVGRVSLDGPGYELALIGGRVYAALAPTRRGETTAAALAIIDVDHPAVPTVVALRDLSLTTVAMTTRDRTMFIGGQDRAANAIVAVLDASRPDEPRVVGSVVVGEGVGVDHLALVGNYLHASVSAMEIVVIDVSDPTRPALVSAPIQAFQVDGMGVAPGDMVVSGGRIAAIEGPQVSLFRAFDPVVWSSPDFESAWLGTLPVKAAQWWHDRALAADGDRIAVAGGSAGGLRIVDAADPESLRLAGDVLSPGTVKCIHVAEGFISVASAGWLYLADRAGPGPMRVTGVWRSPVPGTTCPVAAIGDRLVITYDNGHQLAVLNIADRANPTLIRSFYPDVSVDGRFVLQGGFGYHIGFGDGSRSRLGVVDLRNPDRPVETDNQPWLEGFAADLAGVGNHLLVTADSDLFVYDLSDPARPAQRSRLKLSDTSLAMGIAAAGDRAYVIVRPAGHRVASDHAADAGVGLGSAADARVGPGPAAVTGAVGARALAQTAADLAVVDLSAPAAPRVVARVPISRYAHRVSIDGARLFVLEPNADRFAVYRLDDPTRPVQLGEAALPSVITDLVPAGGAVYAGTLSDGVVRLEP